MGAIPVSVVTGFLGSGKTTLISRILRDPEFARTAVIVNEFGEIGLDHDLIVGGDETLLSLSTGCLCCAVRSDLVTTLLDLERRRVAGEVAFERVLIETSGLADPAPILHALMTDAALGARFRLGQVVVLVDAVLGEATLGAHVEARRQIGFADVAVVTKTDVAPAGPGLAAAVAAAHPGLALRTDVPDIAELFASSSGQVSDAVARHTAGVGACLIRRTRPLPALALTLLLESLAEQCGPRMLRFKGLFDVREAPGRPAVVHAVQHVVSPVTFLDAWPGMARDSRAVVIGVGIPAHFPARLLDAICAEVEDEMQRAG